MRRRAAGMRAPRNHAVSAPWLAMLVVVAGIASLHFAPAVSHGATTARHGAAWKGAVTFSADLEHTFSGVDEHGAPLTLTAAYHERALFKLTGERIGAYSRAQMTGSGTGTAVFTENRESSCTRNSNPWSEWSLARPALVAIWYAAGRLYVVPRIQMQRVHTVFTSCSSVDGDEERVTPVPLFYLGIVGSISGEKVHLGRGVITGSERFPIRMLAMGVTDFAGTAILSWRLRVIDASKPLADARRSSPRSRQAEEDAARRSRSPRQATSNSAALNRLIRSAWGEVRASAGPVSDKPLGLPFAHLRERPLTRPADRRTPVR